MKLEIIYKKLNQSSVSNKKNYFYLAINLNSIGLFCEIIKIKIPKKYFGIN
jgi:hypothetical protein